jgi:hypothetical protein
MVVIEVPLSNHLDSVSKWMSNGHSYVVVNVTTLAQDLSVMEVILT